MKQKSSSLVRVFISVGLIIVLLYLMKDRYKDIFQQIKMTNLSILLIAFLAYQANVFINTQRLHLLLKGEGIDLSFMRIVEFSYMGFFFNNFMPSSLGGDIVKAYYIGKITNQKVKSYIAVFVDRLTGLFTFAFMGGFALFLNRGNHMDPLLKNAIIVFIFFCSGVALFTLHKGTAQFMSNLLSKLKFKNIGHKINKVYDMVHGYSDKKELVLKAMICSVFGQICYFSVVYFLFKALGVDIPYKVVFLIMPLVSVIGMIPSLGGLGVREGGIVALFSPVTGIDAAFGASILLFSILFIISVIGGIIYLISPQFRFKRADLDEALVEGDS